MILYRYLMQQFLQSMLSISGVLLLVLLGSQATSLLSRAITEQQAIEGVLVLLVFSIPRLLIDVLPAALVLTSLTVLPRLYLQNEIVVMHSFGFSRGRVLFSLVSLGVLVAFAMSMLLMFLNPMARQYGNGLFDTMQQNMINNALSPGQFLQIQGKSVYVADKSVDNRIDQIVILDSDQVLLAKEAELLTGGEQGIALVLEQGQQLEQLGQFPAITLTNFQQLSLTLVPSITLARDNITDYPLPQVLANLNQQRYKAELHKRLSLPLMAIVLPLVIFPLCYANARSGKQAKLIPGILIFACYMLLFDNVRRKVTNGSLSEWTGTLWVHLGFLLLALLFWFGPELKRLVRKKA